MHLLKSRNAVHSHLVGSKFFHLIESRWNDVGRCVAEMVQGICRPFKKTVILVGEHFLILGKTLLITVFSEPVLRT